MADYYDWNCIYKTIEEFDIKKGSGEVIKINILAQGIYQMYTIYKELQDRLANKIYPEKPQLDDMFIDYIKINSQKQLHNKIRKLIYLTPALDHQINLKLIKDLRKREMVPLPYIKYNELTDREGDLIKEIWRDKVSIEEKKLRIKPFRREPP